MKAPPRRNAETRQLTGTYPTGEATGAAMRGRVESFGRFACDILILTEIYDRTRPTGFDFVAVHIERVGLAQDLGTGCFGVVPRVEFCALFPRSHLDSNAGAHRR